MSEPMSPERRALLDSLVCERFMPTQRPTEPAGGHVAPVLRIVRAERPLTPHEKLTRDRSAS